MKTVILRPGVEFANCVAEAQKLGLTHDQAFNKICRERPDLMAKQKRAPIIGGPREVRVERIAAEFSNAVSDQTQCDWKNFFSSPQLRSALGISPGDGSAAVATKVSKGVKSLSGSLLSELWNQIVICVGKTTGDNFTAAKTAAKMFPQLAEDAGFKG